MLEHMHRDAHRQHPVQQRRRRVQAAEWRSCHPEGPRESSRLTVFAWVQTDIQCDSMMSRHLAGARVR